MQRSLVHPSLFNPTLIGREVGHTLGTQALQHSSHTHTHTGTKTQTPYLWILFNFRGVAAFPRQKCSQWLDNDQAWNEPSSERTAALSPRGRTDWLTESRSEEHSQLLPVQLHWKLPGNIPPHGSLLSIHWETPSPWLTRPPLHVKYSNNLGILVAINTSKYSCNVKLKNNPLCMGLIK